jgi:hypothetical protein
MRSHSHTNALWEAVKEDVLHDRIWPMRGNRVDVLAMAPIVQSLSTGCQFRISVLSNRWFLIIPILQSLMNGGHARQCRRYGMRDANHRLSGATGAIPTWFKTLLGSTWNGLFVHYDVHTLEIVELITAQGFRH